MQKNDSTFGRLRILHNERHTQRCARILLYCNTMRTATQAVSCEIIENLYSPSLVGYKWTT